MGCVARCGALEEGFTVSGSDSRGPVRRVLHEEHAAGRVETLHGRGMDMVG